MSRTEWAALLAEQSLLGETLRRHREVIEAAVITVSCVSCGQPVVDRPDDPVIHVGCAMAEDSLLADRDEAMTFVPAWVRDALNHWFRYPGIEAADDLRSAIAEWYRTTEEPDHD